MAEKYSGILIVFFGVSVESSEGVGVASLAFFVVLNPVDINIKKSDKNKTAKSIDIKNDFLRIIFSTSTAIYCENIFQI